MKKNVCLLFALVFAFAFSCVAFAADTAIDVDSVVITENGDNFFTVTGNVLNPVDNQQVTILVVPTSILVDGKISGEVADSDIAYINQITIGDENEFSATIGIQANLDATLYSLLLGGTDIAVANQYVGPLVPAKGYTVSGTVAAGGNFGSEDLYATAQVTVKIVELDKTVVANFADFSWAIEEVEDGTYTIVVSKPGWLAQQVNDVVVSGQDVVVATITLSAGDANSDGLVNASDLSMLLGGFGAGSADETYATNIDFNGDCIVNASDLSLLLGSFGVSSNVQ